MKEGKVLYDTFNARYLTFAEVADSFIENEYFTNLLNNTHSLLTGPRGCGKTTLLKMLTPSALKKYKDGEYYNTIPFWGVYIPTDIQWKKQLDQLENEIGSTEIISNISNGTVTINVLQALCKTFSFILKNEIPENKNKEIELSKALIKAWHIGSLIIPTIEGIEIALKQIIADLNADIRKLSFENSNLSIHEIFYYNYFHLAEIGCEIFEVITGISKKRWALCFDELEIAPKWLQEELLEKLRSTANQKFIFKFTTAPIVSFFKQIKNGIEPLSDATENNDFKVIKIWTSNQSDFRLWRLFCEKLLRSKINRQLRANIEPLDIFGSSDLDISVAEMYPKENFAVDKANFEHNTASWYAIRQLARIDPTFLAFLEDKKIDPKNPVPKTTKDRDEVFRKIKQLTVFRLHLLKEGGSLRTRKVLPLYYGLPLLYDLCDGNPRIFIGLVDELLLIAQHSKTIKLNINTQSRIIREISEKNLLTLSSHPDANVIIRGQNYNIRNLLESIGDYFFEKMLTGKFSMDPTGSFKVDAELPGRVLPLIELALYLGAIVYLDNAHDNVLTNDNVFNKKFRLSFILAPYFRLLARDYPDISLSKILTSKNRNDSQQNLLFQS